MLLSSGTIKLFEFLLNILYSINDKNIDIKCYFIKFKVWKGVYIPFELKIPDIFAKHGTRVKLKIFNVLRKANSQNLKHI